MGSDDERPELGDAPPFSTWPRIYAFVVAALVAQVIVFAVITAAYR
jgi:hypothetical protein